MLNILGVEDYGIYNVVGGIVAMFGFLNGAMTTSTQRYLTFELGKGNFQRLRQVFSTSVNIHFLIAVLICIMAETVGLWFMYEKMVIPTERFAAAMWVYQLSILTTVIAILSYPYNAIIVAHERMSVFAFISVMEIILKLAVVYLLKIWDFDKLILYAILIAAVQLFIRFVYSGYCSKHFAESKYQWYIDKPLFKEMLSFAGWNLWGSLASVLSTQGLNMILNVFFGPIVNAARAVAVQVQGAIQMFSANFQMALNPQITKTFAKNELDEMHKLIFRGCRFSFYLLYVISLPVILETPVILELWLKTVPDYSVQFLRIMLLISLVDATANPLMTSAAASGNVRRYQTVVGGVILMILPLTYVAFRLGAPPHAAFVVHFCVCCTAFIVRLFLIRPLIRLSIRAYIKNVVFKCCGVSFLSAVVPACMHYLMKPTIVASVTIMFVSVLSAIMVCYFVGLENNERMLINAKLSQLISKIRN